MGAMLGIVLLLLVAGTVEGVGAARPARAVLTVTIAIPADGWVVGYGDTFVVAGSVLCQRSDAGTVDSYVQYSVGEGTTEFRDVDGADLQIVSGDQPQTRMLLKDESYDVSWVLTGKPGIYEVRIRSAGTSAQPGSSPPRTVTLEGAPPPPGLEVIDDEYQDSTIGFGKATGTYASTYVKDGTYQVLREEKNTQGTKTGADDTSELGWIYVFESLGLRLDTRLYLYGHIYFTGRDTDTAFYIQCETGGSWSTIITMRNPADELYCGDIPDDGTETIRIRVVDDDQTPRNTEISAVYIDQAYIFLSDSCPPSSSGTEILVGFTPPSSVHNVMTLEYRNWGWYNDFNIGGLPSVWHIEIEVANLDGGTDVETVIAEGAGLIQVFKGQSGSMECIYNLTTPNGMGVNSVEVADLDNDGSVDHEILACAGKAVAIWKKVEGTYLLYWNQTTRGSCMSAAVGNLDADGDVEFVVGVYGPPGETPLVMLFENQLGTWQNVANYSGFQVLGNEFDKVDINDVDNDGTNEVIALVWDEPLQVLEYADGGLVNVWTAPFKGYSHGFVTGDVTNDGKIDLVISEYRNYDVLAVFETVSGIITNTFNISFGDLGGDAAYGMDIGDVDRDGLNELVYVQQLAAPTNKLRIFRNNMLIYTKDIGYDCLSVEIGDYDNDAV